MRTTPLARALTRELFMFGMPTELVGIIWGISILLIVFNTKLWPILFLSAILHYILVRIFKKDHYLLKNIISEFKRPETLEP